MNFDALAKSVFSFSGEDGVLESLFSEISPTAHFAVEFGAYDGTKLSNTRNLIVNHGWQALLIEAEDKLYESCRTAYAAHTDVQVLHEAVTPQNINTLFDECGVPEDLDLCVIDIDSYDWHVWKALRHEPKVMLVEYNASFPPPERAVVPYEPGLTATALQHAREDWRNSDDYFGASLQSYCDLAAQKGYELVYCTQDGCNAFFVQAQYFERLGIEDNRPETLYRPPAYRPPRRRHPNGGRYTPRGRGPGGAGHPKSSRWDGIL